jgi:hypothetical protein
MPLVDNLNNHQRALSRNVSLAVNYIEAVKAILTSAEPDDYKLSAVEMLTKLLDHPNDENPMQACLYIRTHHTLGEGLPKLDDIRVASGTLTPRPNTY